MKIRKGFVSNSSSQSFCIYGIYMRTEKIKEKLIEKGYIKDEKSENSWYDDSVFDFFGGNPNKEITENPENYTEEEVIENNKKLFFQRFEFKNPMSEGDGYLGIPWSSINNNETAIKFKQNVEEKIKSVIEDDS